jgi:hypothetical protein
MGLEGIKDQEIDTGRREHHGEVEPLDRERDRRKSLPYRVVLVHLPCRSRMMGVLCEPPALGRAVIKMTRWADHQMGYITDEFS